MSRREAERFEDALQRKATGEAIEGDQAPLVDTALKVSALAGPPPPPPGRLAPGRQRFLAEAAQLRTDRSKRRKKHVPMTPVMKLGTALIAAVLLSGLVLGVGQAAADSLPGEPLYGLKLAIQEARRVLTTDAEAEADLDRALVEERLDEASQMLEQGQAVGSAATERAQQQLEAALHTAAQLQGPAGKQALQHLATSIQQRQRRMERLAGESPDEPLRQLLREMERVRQEAHAGQGDPDGLRRRLRQGTPSVPTDQPDPSHTPGPSQTPSQGEPEATQQPGPSVQPTEQPGNAPGPGPAATQAPGHGGPGQPTEPPGGEPQSPGQQGTPPGGQSGGGSGGGTPQGNGSGNPSQGSGGGGQQGP